MQFRKIIDEDFANIALAQSKTLYNGSEYSMLYLKGWNFFNFESMEIASRDDIIFLRFQPTDKYREDKEDISRYIYLPPIASIENIPNAYELIRQQAKSDNDTMYVMATPQEYVDILGDKYNFKHNEDYDEYLYDPQSLATMKGKKLHSKRNHINNFIKQYNPGEDSKCKFRDYVPSDKDKVIALITGWEENKDFDAQKFEDMMDNEFGVIKMGLKLIQNNMSNIVASVVEYEDKIIGFTLGEITPSNVGIVHIEKGDINFDGIYPFICQQFASRHLSNTRYINRQEDMGLEGLRKSKKSYNPIGFCKKYVVEDKA